MKRVILNFVLGSILLCGNLFAATCELDTIKLGKDKPWKSVVTEEYSILGEVVPNKYIKFGNTTFTYKNDNYANDSGSILTYNNDSNRVVVSNGKVGMQFNCNYTKAKADSAVEPTKLNNIVIKGVGEECTVSIDNMGAVVKTNCLRLTNSKKVKILCTKNKKMCKTENELYGNLKKPDNEVPYQKDSIKEMFIQGVDEQCKVTMDPIGAIINTNCIQLTNSKNVKILCTKNKKMCKTVDEMRSLLKKPTYVPSYNCSKAATQTEKDICNSKSLSALDLKLGNNYLTMKEMMPADTFSALISIQKEWIENRELKCGKLNTFKKREACILDMYNKRLDSFSLMSVSNAELSMLPSFDEVYKNGTTDERFGMGGYYYENGDIDKATKLFRKVFSDRNEDMFDAIMALNYMHNDYAKTFPKITPELLAKNHNSIALSLSELGADTEKVKEVYLKEAYYLNSFAEFRIALEYESGIPKQEYRDKILSFYTECAEDGVPRCQEFVGKVYLNGMGVEQNTVKGIKLLEEAALGDSYFILGNYFYAKHDIEKVKSYYLKASEMDHVESIYNLGVLLQTDKEYKQAIKYFNKAIALDNEYYPPVLELSRMYIEGWGTTPDYAKAIEMLEPVIAYSENEDEKNLAIKNIAIAEYELGLQFLNVKNKTLAFKYMQSSANRDFMYAQYDLARMYFNGDGVEKDDAKVIEWYKRAAKQGHSEAQFFLALRYLDGRGIVKNIPKAEYWARLSAENGYTKGEVLYGIILYNQKNKTGLAWIKKAADDGDKYAKQFLVEIKNK